MTWVRERRREDYVGWVIHVRGTRGQMVIGHPLWRCLAWMLAWRVFPWRFRGLDVCGDVVWMRVYYRSPQ